jgi:hypothetical protein
MQQNEPDICCVRDTVRTVEELISVFPHCCVTLFPASVIMRPRCNRRLSVYIGIVCHLPLNAYLISQASAYFRPIVSNVVEGHQLA